ncbi:MAG TPA: LUD domain-containing protein [Natrialbaceae archaeon]|nr:LUD domain-containing protein [Natrialbaceae archaeon]
MDVDVTGAFTDALETRDVTWSRATPEAFESTLGDAIEEPAVGTPLPFEGVSLPETVTVDPSTDELAEATTGVTAAAFGVADYGSLVLRIDDAGGEPLSLWPERHVAVLDEREILPDMASAIERMAEGTEAGESFVVATGPSATADMGALVQGAHGPKTVHAILLEGL